jgi:hypothetical protein
LLTFTSDSFPERSSVCGLVGVVLVDASVSLWLDFMVRDGWWHLEMIDVDVETSLSAFGKRVGEFRVGFA